MQSYCDVSLNTEVGLLTILRESWKQRKLFFWLIILWLTAWKLFSLGFSAWQRRDIQHNDSPHNDKKWQTQQKRAKMFVRQNQGKSFPK